MIYLTSIALIFVVTAGVKKKDENSSYVFLNLKVLKWSESFSILKWTRTRSAELLKISGGRPKKGHFDIFLFAFSDP